MSVVDDIKTRLNVVDIIREYIELRRAGTNFKALCPFHNEKTPSFIVSPEKQIWHCFGCNEGGDVFGFVMKMEGLEFGEAMKFLAKRAGITLKQQDPKITTKKTKLFDICESAAHFFYKTLTESPYAKEARLYLERRNITPETICEFRLGFALPSWNELNKFLIHEGFRQNDIYDAGLVLRDARGNFYDRFRSRIMFPICNIHGNVVGFTGRILPLESKNQQSKEQQAKYINTPQTLIYNKSEVLYGLTKAKEHIRKEDLAVVVEGNMDVLSSHQAQTKNVVASSGTALTREQVGLLARYSNNIAVAFDADQAGETAAKRGIDTALEQGINVRVIVMPELEPNGVAAKDPDELIRKNPKLWNKAVGTSLHFLEFYFGKILNKFNLSRIEEKRKAIEMLLKEISKLQNTIEVSYWVKKLAEVTDVSEEILRENIQLGKKKREESGGGLSLLGQNRSALCSERMLALVLEFPENISYLVNGFSSEMLTPTAFKNLYTHLLLFYNDYKKQSSLNNNLSMSALNFEKWLKKLGKEQDFVPLLNRLSLLVSKDYKNFSAEQIQGEIEKVAALLRQDYLMRKRKELEKEMKEAEEIDDLPKITELTQKFKELS